jgi:signal transduction histidine kinase
MITNQIKSKFQSYVALSAIVVAALLVLNIYFVQLESKHSVQRLNLATELLLQTLVANDDEFNDYRQVVSQAEQLFAWGNNDFSIPVNLIKISLADGTVVYKHSKLAKNPLATFASTQKITFKTQQLGSLSIQIGTTKRPVEVLYSTPHLIVINLILLLIGGFGIYFLKSHSTELTSIKNQLLKSVAETKHQADKSGRTLDPNLNADYMLSQFLKHFHYNDAVNSGEVKQHIVGIKLLQYQLNRLYSVLEATPQGIIVLDEGGDTSFINQKARYWLGLNDDRNFNKRPSSWCEDKKMVEFFNMFNNRVTAVHFDKVHEFTPSVAKDKTMEIRAYPLYAIDEQKSAAGLIFEIRDVSEATLAKKHRSEFVAHIAHELKTPLNVLAMYSEALQDVDEEDVEFRTEAVNVIFDEVERLSLLISNLLSLTQFEMGSMNIQRTRVRIGDFLEDVYENITKMARGKDIKFSLDIPRDMSPLTIDKGLMRIAVNNLLTNAIKYSRDGDAIALSAEENDNYIRIKVADTGIGIAPEDQEKIFEKFYRSEDDEARQASGHGLGLPLCLQIVQLHHGNIIVNSELGIGSEFIIEFNKNIGLVGDMI